MFDDLKESTLNRRTLLRSAGGFALGAGALGLLTGCGGDDNNGTSIPVQPGDASAVLNFALNLEYLEAAYYLRAVGRSAEFTGNSGGGPEPIYPATAQVDFAGSPDVEAYAKEIAEDEFNHVKYLRTVLGAGAVATPKLDLKNSFTAVARAKGIVGPDQDFDPFSSPLAFVIGAFIFEDVGVTAYSGGARVLINGNVAVDTILKAAGILAVEAYHAGLIRTFLYVHRNDPVANFDVAGTVGAISQFRASLGGGKDQGIGPGSGNASNIVPADDNSIAFERTTAEVINIVTAGGTEGDTTKKTGGFFPNGLNGAVVK